ncbi:uncharacterized protein LOC142586212 [Dermacentor variabilis]|uniref:uncharacterized protein LOC142586212 n=1 Tax=Dermacentor variabilis TaxID=34621 RepID=UPI003F5C3845
MEVIIVSAVPTVEDQPFPRVGLLYAYTFKGLEASFNCFSAMILLFGAVGRIKPALTVFLYWNVFSTITCLPLNIGLFHTKSGDEQYSLDFKQRNRFALQFAGGLVREARGCAAHHDETACGQPATRSRRSLRGLT